jgi:hypothetical protein
MPICEKGESEKVCLHGVLPSVNTMVLPCDLHWDVTGITKSDSPSLPAVLHDKAGVQSKGAQLLARRAEIEAALEALAAIPERQGTGMACGSGGATSATVKSKKPAKLTKGRKPRLLHAKVNSSLVVDSWKFASAAGSLWEECHGWGEFSPVSVLGSSVLL